MQVRWRDLVIVDYEVDFPNATKYELDLYSSGLQLFPQVVLGIDRTWGRVRRVGVVDIPVADYDVVLEEFARNCLTSVFIRDSLTVLNNLFRSLDLACETLEEHLVKRQPLEANFLENATRCLHQLMAFHVLNWILPLDEMLSRLQLLLGTRANARATLLSLMVPFTSSHVLDGFGVLGPKEPTVREPTELLYEDRHAQRLARDALSLWLRSNGDPESLIFLTNLVRLCRLAAEEEEQRRRIQSRWMTITRKLPQDLSCQRSERLEPPPLPKYLLRQDEQSWNWLSDNATEPS